MSIMTPELNIYPKKNLVVGHIDAVVLLQAVWEAVADFPMLEA